ncbi:hypothetical protein PBY51_012845 [Eleginops maclovinus]|uniref:Uncharacterized protein n=1 Tax=Eleginops maclovinus TaxID=56733 RepID=A0AAN7Y3X1_ELEMC|nr:hypothetical protein PBY51_012845 [Eleginops maclovinus]
MDTISAALACCLLAISIAVVQAENNTAISPALPTPSSNPTNVTTAAPSPAERVTVISNLTENTTAFTSTAPDSETYTGITAATNESTGHPSQPTTIMTPLTNTTSQTTTTPGNHTTTSTAQTATQPPAGNTSTPAATVIATDPSHTVITTSGSMNRTTQGLRLNISETNMTVIFSVVLGVFTLALVGLMFHRCQHKIQYSHQPLNNTDAFVADDDTLVISGGLYDGHPIYDNVPTDPAADQSQFRLQFLH